LQDLFRGRAHISTKVFSLCFASWGGRLTVGGYSTWYHDDRVHWTPMRASKYYFAFPSSLGLVPPGDAESTTMHGDFGVTIIDSGTTYTYFPRPLFNNLIKYLAKYCQEHDGCGATREGGECWRLRDDSYGPDQFPTIRFHFQGGAEVDWSPRAYMHERGVQGVWCQTFMENNLYQTVLGISWMLHKDVIFDLASGRLGVARANCPEHHRGADEMAEAASLQRKFDRATWELPAASGRSPPAWLLGGSGVVVATATVALLVLATLRQRAAVWSALVAVPAASELCRSEAAHASVPMLCTE